MSDRKRVVVRVATTHPVAAYGGKQLSRRALAQLAEALRSGRVPMVLHHNRINDLHARCISAEVVDLDDGYQAVDANLEVDAKPWDQWTSQLEELGVPGGMSFTTSEPIGEISPDDPAAVGRFAVFADAGYFSDEDITAAASELASAGTVRTGRLYQFSAVQACRIVVEYVHDSGGLEGAKIGLEIGIALVSAAIYDCIRELLRRRPGRPKYPPPPTEPPPESDRDEPAQIEIHTTSEPGGVTTQTFQIRTNDEAVVRRALDHIIEAATRPNQPVVEWDDGQAEWRAP